MVSKRRKICFLITGLEIGGAEMVLYKLVGKINRVSYEPIVISLLPPGPVARKIMCQNIPVYSLHIKSKTNFITLWKLIGLFKKFSPDILHTHCFHANILGRIIARILNIPIVISSIHTINLGSVRREMLLRMSDQWATVTTTVCQAAAEKLIERGIVKQDKIKVIYNGIDNENYPLQIETNKGLARERYGFKKQIPLLLNVGGLRKPKGHIVLLEAAAILKKKGIAFLFVIAGEGKLRQHLEVVIEDLRLERYVRLLGQRDDIPELMAAADVFVLSSLWEGLPLVVLEAMASGLPVVSTNVGGVPELVVDNETGFLVPPENPQLLAEAIERMLSLPEHQRLAMGQAGKKRIEENFTLNKMVSAYEDLYLECLKIRDI